jgi:hypothetical protein
VIVHPLPRGQGNYEARGKPEVGQRTLDQSLLTCSIPHGSSTIFIPGHVVCSHALAQLVGHVLGTCVVHVGGRVLKLDVHTRITDTWTHPTQGLSVDVATVYSGVSPKHSDSDFIFTLFLPSSSSTLISYSNVLLFIIHPQPRCFLNHGQHRCLPPHSVQVSRLETTGGK